MVGVIAFGVFRPLSVQFSWLTANKRREQRVPEKKPGRGTDKSLQPPQIPLRNHLTTAILTGIVTHFLTGIDIHDDATRDKMRQVGASSLVSL